MPVVHLADAHIEASESPSRQDKEDKHHPWLYVVMWMADVDGQPVGSSARWPPRKGHAPSWHSARLVGEGSSVNSAICDLRVELWQQADKGAQHMVAGPAVLPVAELATTPTNVSLALHGPSTAKPTSYAIQLHVVAEAPTRKSLFLIRHAESKWNAAKRDKNVYKMVRQHDHPINEHGYKQAASLQARLTAAAEDERQRPNEPDSKPAGVECAPLDLLEDSNPCPTPPARLVPPGAPAAATHPRAPPQRLGSVPWPQQPASGRPRVEDAPLATCQASRRSRTS